LIDLIALTALAFRQRRATAAEILVLRRQIALYKERGIKPRRIDPATRISLALLSRLFNWRDALAIVRPETMIRCARRLDFKINTNTCFMIATVSLRSTSTSRS